MRDRKVDSPIQYFILFVVSVFSGVFNIIPGISGGTLFVATGYYRQQVFDMARLPKFEFKNSSYWITMSRLAIIGLGKLAGIVVTAFLMDYLFKGYERLTFFIIGALILLSAFESIKFQRPKIKEYWVTFAVVFTLPITLAILGETEIINLSNLGIIAVLIAGFISTAVMILPGVSGSLILVVLGIYTIMTDTINSFSKWFTGSGSIKGFEILIYFGGALAGAIFAVTTLVKLFNNKMEMVKVGAFGIILSSAIAVFIYALT